MEQPAEQKKYFTRPGNLACVSLSDGTHYIGRVVYESNTPSGTIFHNDRLEDAVRIEGVDFQKLYSKIEIEVDIEFKNQPSNVNAAQERELARKGKHLIRNPERIISQRFDSEITRMYEEAKTKSGEQSRAEITFTDKEKMYFATTHLS